MLQLLCKKAPIIFNDCKQKGLKKVDFMALMIIPTTTIRHLVVTRTIEALCIWM